MCWVPAPQTVCNFLPLVVLAGFPVVEDRGVLGTVATPDEVDKARPVAGEEEEERVLGNTELAGHDLIRVPAKKEIEDGIESHHHEARSERVGPLIHIKLLNCDERSDELAS